MLSIRIDYKSLGEAIATARGYWRAGNLSQAVAAMDELMCDLQSVGAWLEAPGAWPRHYEMCAHIEGLREKMLAEAKKKETT